MHCQAAWISLLPVYNKEPSAGRHGKQAAERSGTSLPPALLTCPPPHVHPLPPCRLRQLPPGQVPLSVRVVKLSEAAVHGIKVTLTFLATAPGK